MPERYTVLRELGRGAIGAVYAAQDRNTGAVVALKTLSSADAGLAGRFLKQARSASRLSHRNIVKVHDAGEIAGTVYAAMELVEGESLRAILERGPLGIARALRVTRDIAEGLAHAHLEGLVHGSLKPSNVFVLRTGEVKVADFGTGRAAAPCPEQARGEAVDHRCDLFSLGALLYELLTHRAPPQGDAPPRPPSELNPHVPRALDRLVLSLLAREPAQRMPGVPILLRELQRLEDALGLDSRASAADPSPAEAIALMERESRSVRPSGSRSPVLAALALVLAAAGLGFAAYTYWYPSPAPAVAAAPPPAAEPVEAPAPAPVPRPLPVPRAIEEPAAPPAAAPEPVALKPVEPKIPEQQPARSAQLILAVSPRGEIYIDGKHHGTTPPLKTLDLEPGMRRIEVRSGSRKPYLTYMTVEPGEVRRIRHDFNSKGRPPPGRAP